MILIPPYLAEVCTGNNKFFGFPHWWKYIAKSTTDPVTKKCVPDFTFPGDIWSVALAVLDMLLYAAGLIAVVMVIVAGVSYMTSSGNPEKAASARRRIYNALIGLAIVLVSTAVVSFVGDRLGG